MLAEKQEAGDMFAAIHLNLSDHGGVTDCFWVYPPPPTLQIENMTQGLTVCRQGLELGAVVQAAGNLQLNPARLEAEQPLEQQVALMWREMI